MPTTTNTMQIESPDNQGSDQLTALKSQIFKSMVDNDAKLQFIREEISSGRYQIQSRTIASKLVTHHNLIEEQELVS